MSIRSLAAALLLVPGFALAQEMTYVLPEETTAFRPGKGVDVAESNCMTCHSADYLSTQPPDMGAAFWAGEVKKMITVYGAPIDDADAEAISAYLASTY